MSDVEKMMEVPLGSIGGPEYVKQEQEAGVEILKQRIARAEEALEEALNAQDGELKDAKIRAAQDVLKTTISDIEKIAE